MSLDNINIICLVLGCVPLINIIYLIKIGLQVVIYSCVMTRTTSEHFTISVSNPYSAMW